MTTTTSSKGRLGLLILSRAAAAILGGYALVSAATIFLGAVLPIIFPMSRAEAVLTSTLLSFFVYTGVIIWVYAEHNIRRVWWGLLGGSAVLGGVGLLLSRGGA